MAFYDWNHDGKKDYKDDLMEYQIYKNCRNINNSNNSNGSSNSGDLSVLWIILMLVIITGICPPLGVIIALGILIFG